MGEINEVLGRQGKKFFVNGQEYDVFPAPIKDLEVLMEKQSKIIMDKDKFSYNFYDFADELPEAKKERIEAIYYILDKAFGGNLKTKALETIDRKTAFEVIKFFLVD